jgi:hypothetical protein
MSGNGRLGSFVKPLPKNVINIGRMTLNTPDCVVSGISLFLSVLEAVYNAVQPRTTINNSPTTE